MPVKSNLRKIYRTLRIFIFLQDLQDLHRGLRFRHLINSSSSSSLPSSPTTPKLPTPTTIRSSRVRNPSRCWSKSGTCSAPTTSEATAQAWTKTLTGRRRRASGRASCPPTAAPTEPGGRPPCSSTVSVTQHKIFFNTFLRLEIHSQYGNNFLLSLLFSGQTGRYEIQRGKKVLIQTNRSADTALWVTVRRADQDYKGIPVLRANPELGPQGEAGN